MNLSDLMQAQLLEATRLTQQGRLGDATDLIRRTLAQGVMSGVDPAAIEALFGAPARAEPAESAAPAKGAAPGRLLSRTFDGATGHVRYLLYVPGAHAAQPAAALPLVLMLHGCTQSPEDFAVSSRMNRLADAHGFLVAYPAQTHHANPSGCWNWFEPADQRRGAGEPALLADLTRAIVAEWGVDAQRVYAAGMSAGGAMAVILGQEYPDLYAAIGVHSGLPYAAAHDMSSAMTVMKRGAQPDAAQPAAPARASVPTIVFHGDRDYMVNVRNGVEVIRRVRESYAAHAEPDAPVAESVDDGRTAGGRTFTRTVLADADGRPVLEQWLLHGSGHAWSGGSPDSLNSDPRGPDASAEMVRFFAVHALSAAGRH